MAGQDTVEWTVDAICAETGIPESPLIRKIKSSLTANCVSVATLKDLSEKAVSGEAAAGDIMDMCPDSPKMPKALAAALGKVLYKRRPLK